MELLVTMQVSPENLEAAREEAERLPAVEITEVDLQWVHFPGGFCRHTLGGV